MSSTRSTGARSRRPARRAPRHREPRRRPKGHWEPRSPPERGAGRAPWRRVDPVASGRKRRGRRAAERSGRMEERADAATRQGDQPGFLQTLQTQSRAEAARAAARVQEEDLRRWGLTGQWPRAHFRPADTSPGRAAPRAGRRATSGAGRRTARGPSWGLFPCGLRTFLPFPHLPRGRAGRSPSWDQVAMARPVPRAALAGAAGEGFRAPARGAGDGELGEALSSWGDLPLRRRRMS